MGDRALIMISEPLQRCGVRTRVFYDRVSMGQPRDGYVRDDLDRLRMYYDKGLIRNHVSISVLLYTVQSCRVPVPTRQHHSVRAKLAYSIRLRQQNGELVEVVA